MNASFLEVAQLQTNQTVKKIPITLVIRLKIRVDIMVSTGHQSIPQHPQSQTQTSQLSYQHNQPGIKL